MDNIKDYIQEKILQEIKFKRVMRKGKVVKKKVCPDNAKVAGNRCVPITGSEKLKLKKAAKKRARKMKAKMGKILKKRAKSMKKRAMLNLPKG
jgi:hypothetical protein